MASSFSHWSAAPAEACRRRWPSSSSARRLPLPLRLRCIPSGDGDRSSFMEQILDYIQGGPKLRRWYGGIKPARDDGIDLSVYSPAAGVEMDAGDVRDAVLVTDGDSDIGQMVILSLILRRARIKAFVKDKRAAVDAFGSYVEPIAAHESREFSLKKALQGVRAVISLSKEGFLSSIGQMKGVEHIVLLSQLAVYEGSSGIQALVSGNARKLAERDEEFVITSGIPYTIIRSGALQDSPDGKEGFNFKEGVAAKGKLNKENAAHICVEALEAIPEKGLIKEVANGEEKISNWKEWFASAVRKN